MPSICRQGGSKCQKSAFLGAFLHSFGFIPPFFVTDAS